MLREELTESIPESSGYGGRCRFRVILSREDPQVDLFCLPELGKELRKAGIENPFFDRDDVVVAIELGLLIIAIAEKDDRRTITIAKKTGDLPLHPCIMVGGMQENAGRLCKGVNVIGGKTLQPLQNIGIV